MRLETTVGKHTIGIIYMAFGQNSANAVTNNINSLHRLGIDIPAVVVGNTEVPGTLFKRWEGKSPFKKNPKDPDHTFFAGNVKPFIYDLSPFDYTLYLDADTEFRKDPLPGFHFLDKCDFALYQARPDQLTIEVILTDPKIYNGFSVKCTKDTIADAKKAHEPSPGVICSGILFFKKSSAVRSLFQSWYAEWLKYPAWDEQGPLIRALRIHEGKDIVVTRLSALWNSNSANKDQIIHHNWGTGEARDDREVNVAYAPPPPEKIKKQVLVDDGTPIAIIESIPGYLGVEEEKELYRRAKMVPRDGFIVELGSLFGRSVTALALGAPRALIYTVDTYDQTKLGTLTGKIDWSPIGNFNRLRNLKIENVRFMKGDTRTVVLPNKPIDLLFIDAGHQYEEVKADIFKYGPRSKTIICHDYRSEDIDADSWPGVTRAVDEFLLAYPEYRIFNHVSSTVTLCKV